jgi:hypothetical protein
MTKLGTDGTFTNFHSSKNWGAFRLSAVSSAPSFSIDTLNDADIVCPGKAYINRIEERRKQCNFTVRPAWLCCSLLFSCA